MQIHGTLFALYETLYHYTIAKNFTTMMLFTDYFSRLKKNLRDGVMYVFTPSRKSNAEFNRLSPRLLHLLEKITGFKIELKEVPHDMMMDTGTTLMSRRFNVGNAGKDAVVRMDLNTDSFSDIVRFAESAIDVVGTDEGDQVLTAKINIHEENPDELEVFAASGINNYYDYEEFPGEDIPKPASEARACRRLNKESLEQYIDFFEEADLSNSLKFSVEKSSPSLPAIDKEEQEEEQEILTIEQQKEQALRDIQAKILEYVTTYHDDPTQLLNTMLEGKIVLGQKDQLSKLVVNNDLKIVLPNYNEVEVKMPAMCRTIYILFLKHHEGIALRDIAGHRADLESIYSVVKPGRSEEKAKESIDNLLDPMSNTLNEYISKINRCFKSCILNNKLADHYCITGKRGETYRIDLAPELITLPKAVGD